MVLVGACALVACSSAKPNPTDANYSGMGGPGDPNVTRLGGDDSGMVFGVNKNRGGGGGTGIGVNAFLWRGALDTLSFFPLASADPFGGVIITDWWAPAAADGERFKATAYIMSQDLRSDGIKISIFHQVLQNGQWVDAPVSQAMVGEIEDKVLDKARKLKGQALTTG
jgi:hypothetical protein